MASVPFAYVCSSSSGDNSDESSPTNHVQPRRRESPPSDSSSSFRAAAAASSAANRTVALNSNIGRTQNYRNVSIPPQPTTRQMVKKVCVGKEHIMALVHKNTTDLYICGKNTRGQLGMPFARRNSVTQLTKVSKDTHLGDYEIFDIFAGPYSSYMVREYDQYRSMWVSGKLLQIMNSTLYRRFTSVFIFDDYTFINPIMYFNEKFVIIKYWINGDFKILLMGLLQFETVINRTSKVFKEDLNENNDFNFNNITQNIKNHFNTLFQLDQMHIIIHNEHEITPNPNPYILVYGFSMNGSKFVIIKNDITGSCVVKEYDTIPENGRLTSPITRFVNSHNGVYIYMKTGIEGKIIHLTDDDTGDTGDTGDKFFKVTSNMTANYMGGCSDFLILKSEYDDVYVISHHDNIPNIDNDILSDIDDNPYEDDNIIIDDINKEHFKTVKKVIHDDLRQLYGLIVDMNSLILYIEDEYKPKILMYGNICQNCRDDNNILNINFS